MKSESMILLSDVCLYYNIELSFIYSLRESGLIDIIHMEEKAFVSASQLKQLEDHMRLQQEMDINLEGIETISYLLQRIRDMQLHIVQLNNRLAFYQNE
ncbi:MAG: chaperone modulator CbpM [Ferruginibacter sp.]